MADCVHHTTAWRIRTFGSLYICAHYRLVPMLTFTHASQKRVKITDLHTIAICEGHADIHRHMVTYLNLSFQMLTLCNASHVAPTFCRPWFGSAWRHTRRWARWSWDIPPTASSQSCRDLDRTHPCWCSPS